MTYAFYQEFCHGSLSKDGEKWNFRFVLYEYYGESCDIDDTSFEKNSDRLIIKELEIEEN